MHAKTYQLSVPQESATEQFHALNFHGIAWWKAGEGKTRLGLHLWWKIRKEANKVLVVTRKVAFEDWEREAHDKMHLLPCRVVDLFSARPNDYTDWIPSIFLISADSLHRIQDMNPIVPVWKWVVIVDELYLFGNVKSRRAKALKRITEYALGSIGLSATIMPAKDNLAIWGQLSALNLEKKLARNRTEFIHEYQDRLSLSFGTKFVNKKGSVSLILDKIKDVIHLHYPKNNERTIHESIIQTSPLPTQIRDFDDLKSNWELRGKEFKHKPQIIHAISGISNGWIKNEDGSITDVASSKLDRTVALVEELLTSGERIVLWCAYCADVDRLRAVLPCPTLPFVGGTPFDSDTWKNGKVSVVVATESSGASVNHFEQVSVAIYYSVNYKWLDLQQSMGRTDRRSSKHDECFYYFMQTEFSLDSEILKTVRQSKQGEKQVINLLSSLIENKQNETRIN